MSVSLLLAALSSALSARSSSQRSSEPVRNAALAKRLRSPAAAPHYRSAPLPAIAVRLTHSPPLLTRAPPHSAALTAAAFPMAQQPPTRRTGGRPAAAPAPSASASSSLGSLSWPQWLSAHLGLLGAAAAGLTAAGVAALWWRRRRAQRARAAAAAAAAAARTSPEPAATSPTSRRGRAPRRSVPPANSDAAAAASNSSNAQPVAAASPAVQRSPASNNLAPIIVQASPARAAAAMSPASSLPSFAQLMASPLAASAAASSQPAEQSGATGSDGEVLLPSKPAPELPDSSPAAAASSARPRSPPPGFFAQMLEPPSRAPSSTALVQASTPMLNRRFGTPRQAIRLNFGDSADSSSSSDNASAPGRRVLEILCVVMLVLVVMVLMQDARWLAPISPALLYCMFTVAQERSRMEDEEDLLALDDTPRHPASSSSSSSSSSSAPLNLTVPRSSLAHRAARNQPPTQGLSLFGYSVRVPTPSRTPSGRLQGRLPVASARGPLRPSTAMPSIPASASSSSSSAATPHRHLAANLRTGAIPFPSLVSPPAAAAAAAMSTSPRSPARNNNPHPAHLHGSSGLVLQQPRPQRTVSGDASVLARSFSMQEDDNVFSPGLDRVDSDTEQSLSDSNQNKKSPRQQEEQKEQHAAVTSVSSPRVDAQAIAASLSRSAPLAIQLPARKIDVHAALSRMHNAPATAAAAPRSNLTHSSSDLSSSVPTSASDSDTAPTDEEVSFFNGHSRRDSALSLDSLPRSAATATSFRLHFNFAFSFEEVMRAFWNMGETEDAAAAGTSTAAGASTGAGTGTEEEGEDPQSDTPPYTPTKMTPSHSYSQLAGGSAAAAASSMGSPIEHPVAAARGHHSSSSQSQLSALDLEVESLSDTGEQVSPAAAASSSSSSAATVPIRYAVRRVSTPLRLPLVLRKLLGTGRRWVTEDRIACDVSRRLVKLQSQSRVLEPFLSLVSSQTIAPHPSNPAHTRWSCEIKLHVYSSCGLLRGDVVNWISAMSKQRQHQISLLLSASIKRQVQRERQAELAAQLAQQTIEFEGAVISPIIRQRSAGRRQDSSARKPSAGSLAQMHAAANPQQQHNRRG